jgi:hypothetical protein
MKTPYAVWRGKASGDAIKSNIIVPPTRTGDGNGGTNQSSIMYSSTIVLGFLSSWCWKLVRQPKIIDAGLGAALLNA